MNQNVVAIRGPLTLIAECRLRPESQRFALDTDLHVPAGRAALVAKDSSLNRWVVVEVVDAVAISSGGRA